MSRAKELVVNTERFPVLPRYCFHPIPSPASTNSTPSYHMRIMCSTVRLDAPTDAPGWRNALGTHSAGSMRPSLPQQGSAEPVGEISSAAPSGRGQASACAKTGGPDSAELKVFPGEWSTVTGALRAVAEALIAAESVRGRSAYVYAPNRLVEPHLLRVRASGLIVLHWAISRRALARPILT